MEYQTKLSVLSALVQVAKIKNLTSLFWVNYFLHLGYKRASSPYNLGKYYLLVEFVLIIFLPLFLPRLVLNSSKAMAMAITLLVIGAATFFAVIAAAVAAAVILLVGCEVLFFDLYCFFLKPKRD